MPTVRARLIVKAPAAAAIMARPADRWRNVTEESARTPLDLLVKHAQNPADAARHVPARRLGTASSTPTRRSEPRTAERRVAVASTGMDPDADRPNQERQTRRSLSAPPGGSPPEPCLAPPLAAVRSDRSSVAVVDAPWGWHAPPQPSAFTRLLGRRGVMQSMAPDPRPSEGRDAERPATGARRDQVDADREETKWISRACRRS